MQFAQGKPRPQSSNALPMPRRRGPLADLRVETSAPNTHIALAVSDSSASTSALSSAASEDYSLPFGPVSKPRSTRNMKKLSLTLPSAHSSTNSLTFANPAPPSEDRPFGATDPDTSTRVGRRASVLSLPACSTGTGLLHRKDEDGSPSAPYLDGPIEILPGVWLGSEDNARDWKELSERNITAILNVAKEVVSPFDSANAQPMRPFQSTPNPSATSRESRSTFYPAQLGSERPAMHYLKLKWSHGQADLVKAGFPEAMAFVDATLLRNEGVLIQFVALSTAFWTNILTVCYFLVASVVFRGPPPLSSLSLCGQQRLLRLQYPSKYGS
jgi:tyrosine-protein phosphatase